MKKWKKPKKYNIIYADPPWRKAMGDGLTGGFSPPAKDGVRHIAPAGYPTLHAKEITELPVQKIAAQDAVLFLWTTDSTLPEALQIIEAWEFKYVTIGFVWEKLTSKGHRVHLMSQWTLKTTEICLLATKGQPHSLLRRRNIKQFVSAKRTIHSRKPKAVRSRIVKLLGDLPRIELFAREKPKGWDVWGNEVKSNIILEPKPKKWKRPKGKK